jgi:hypothetical protein
MLNSRIQKFNDLRFFLGCFGHTLLWNRFALGVLEILTLRCLVLIFLDKKQFNIKHLKNQYKNTENRQEKSYD